MCRNFVGFQSSNQCNLSSRKLGFGRTAAALLVQLYKFERITSIHTFMRASVVTVIFLATILNSVAATSPKLILNGEVSDCVLSDLVISGATGDVQLGISNLSDCFSSEAGLAVTPVMVIPNTVQPPATVEVLWGSSGADTCRAGGNLPAWNNQGTLPLEGQRTLNVPSGTSTGAYRLEVLCSVDGGAEVSGQAGNNLTVTSPSAPPQPSLSLSPTSPINPGASVTVNWSSENATSCSANGTFPGWPGGKATSGSQTITTSTSLAPGTYSLTLTCANAGGTSLAAQTSIVVESGTPSACTGDRAPPPGLQRASACLLGNESSADCRSYASVFNGLPGTTNLRFFGPPAGSFVAMQIGPATIPAAATVDITRGELQGQWADYRPGPFIWSISTCPGDFNEAAITAESGEGCIGSSPTGLPPRFGGSNWTSSLVRCGLSSGTRYYFNVLYTNQPVGTPNANLTSNCPENRCGHQLQALSGGW